MEAKKQNELDYIHYVTNTLASMFEMIQEIQEELEKAKRVRKAMKKMLEEMKPPTRTTLVGIPGVAPVRPDMIFSEPPPPGPNEVRQENEGSLAVMPQKESGFGIDMGMSRYHDFKKREYMSYQ
jgi:hypothetical protein